MTNAIHSLITYLRHKEIEIEDGQASFKHQIIQINYISYNITTYLKISPLRPSPVSTWELLMEYSKAMPNVIERRGWSGWESYIPSLASVCTYGLILNRTLYIIRHFLRHYISWSQSLIIFLNSY